MITVKLKTVLPACMAKHKRAAEYKKLWDKVGGTEVTIGPPSSKESMYVGCSSDTFWFLLAGPLLEEILLQEKRRDPFFSPTDPEFIPMVCRHMLEIGD